MINYIEKKLRAENESIAIWVTIFFSFGILLYFSYSFEPDFIYCLLALFLSLSLIFVYYRYQSLFFKTISWFIIALMFGQTVASYRAHSLIAPIINSEDRIYKVKGIISNIEIKENGRRLTLEKVSIAKFPKNRLPVKIRILVRTEINNPQIGDQVRLLAKLTPPPLPNLPNGYDFARYSYFQQIGAVGFAISKVDITTTKHNNIFIYITNLRNKIVQEAQSILDLDPANVATALMVGDYSSLSSELLTNFRISGLSHLLSVSGMHLSLVALIFFFCSRFLLNLSLNIAENANVKKIAAFISIFGSFLYLALSGWQIAAVRSFIMTSLVLLATIFEREALTLRTLAVAYFIILLFAPENIINPSFQMSFAAVMALISSYTYCQKITNKLFVNSILGKVIHYFINLTLSSLVAGIATAPFVAFYFNQFSLYSILANLIAVPLTSFYLMPLVIIAFFLFPLGLFKYPLLAMNHGLSILIDTANYFAQLPQSSQIIPFIPGWSFFLLNFGFIWLCLWQTKWRLSGILFILFAVISVALSPKADIVIFPKQRNFAFINDGDLIFAFKKIGKQTKNTLMNWYKQDKFQHFTNYTKPLPHIACDEQSCLWHVKKEKIYINYANESLNCNIADLIIDFAGNHHCPNYYGKAQLEQMSNFFIYSNPLHVETIEQQRGNRLWSGGR